MERGKMSMRTEKEIRKRLKVLRNLEIKGIDALVSESLCAAIANLEWVLGER